MKYWKLDLFTFMKIQFSPERLYDRRSPSNKKARHMGNGQKSSAIQSIVNKIRFLD